MNNFRDELKVSKEIQEAIDNVAKVYQQQGRVMEDDDKRKLKIYLNFLDKKVKGNEFDEK